MIQPITAQTSASIGDWETIALSPDLGDWHMRKRSDPDRAGWSEQLKVLQDEIAAMPIGPQRDAAQHRADQLKAAIQMEGWLKSAELKRPD